MATERSPIKVPCENESLMNLLRGVFPVKGEGGGDCTHYLSFSGDRLSQADAKVASGTKGKICRF